MGYTPLDSDALFSSIMWEGLDTWGCWCAILASKDQDGVTPLTPESLANLTREPIEKVRACWEKLTLPDPRSRSKAYEGRRLVQREDGRWWVVTSQEYRDKHSGAQYRERAAERQRRRRERLAQQPAGVVQHKPVSPEENGVVKPPRVHVTREATGERVPLEQSYQPSPEYPTRESREAANLEAGELCQWLEGRVGRSTGEVFRAAADYPGANGFKTRAESCSPARLEQTLTTLRDWKRRIIGEHREMMAAQAWELKPAPGAQQQRPWKRDQVDMHDEAQRILEEDARARAGGDAAGVGDGEPRRALEAGWSEGAGAQGAPVGRGSDR